MFAVKGRLKVTLLIVGVLVLGLGLHAAFQVQEVEAHPHPGWSCSDARSICCNAIHVAQQICGTFPSSGECADAAEDVNLYCSIAAAVCGGFSCS